MDRRAALAVRARALVHDVRDRPSAGRPEPAPTSGDTVTIQVEVTNTGTRTGDEVVQLYVRDEEATVARPVRELRGFQRLRLAAGECRTVTFHLSTEQLAYVDVELRRIVEPGTVRLFGRSVRGRPPSPRTSRWSGRSWSLSSGATT